MRWTIRWLLVITLVLAIGALWWPQRGTTEIVQAERVGRADPSASIVIDPRGVMLPAQLVSTALDEAESDPFVPPQLTPPAAPPSPNPFVGPPYVPPPAPPTITYRYLGQMTDPEGKQLVYLARADKDLQVTVGTRLDEGYTVEAITAEGVRLLYAPAGARVTIPIPPAPPDSSSPVR